MTQAELSVVKKAHAIIKKEADQAAWPFENTKLSQALGLLEALIESEPST